MRAPLSSVERGVGVRTALLSPHTIHTTPCVTTLRAIDISIEREIAICIINIYQLIPFKRKHNRREQDSERRARKKENLIKNMNDFDYDYFRSNVRGTHASSSSRFLSAASSSSSWLLKRQLDNGSSTDSTSTESGLQLDNGASSENTNTESGFHQQEQGDDPYEFVAFLLWYIFLVLCCIVPTCCAYRRRRMIERRMIEQHANMAQFQQANLFFLNATNNRQSALHEEGLQQQRELLLTEALKPTTMIIKIGDLKELDDTGSSARRPNACPVIARHDNGKINDGGNSSKSVSATTTKAEVSSSSQEPNNNNKSVDNNCNDNKEDKDPEIALGVTNDTVLTNDTAEDEDFTDLELEYNFVLLLPAAGEDEEASQSQQQQAKQRQPPSKTYRRCVREVAGSCAICLSPYEVGDSVTWAAVDVEEETPELLFGSTAADSYAALGGGVTGEAGEESSSSAAAPRGTGAESNSTTKSTVKPGCPHAFHTECIIGWLSKKESPKCPVCRQSFCRPVHAVVHALSPDGSSNNNHMLGVGVGEIPFPFSRTLAETVALARFSMAAQQQQIQQQQQQHIVLVQPQGQSSTSTTSLGGGGGGATEASAAGIRTNNNNSPVLMELRTMATPATTTTNPVERGRSDPPGATVSSGDHP